MGSFDFKKGIEEEKVSKYHGAFLYVQRIDNILRDLDDIHIYRETELEFKTIRTIIGKNYALLKILFNEIIGRLKDKERDELFKKEKKIRELYKEFLRLYNSDKKINNKFLEDFDDWERDLRIIADEKGLIMPDKEADTGL